MTATSWIAVALLAAGSARAAEQATPQVIAFYPHDPDAFTQGLLLHEGFFYESTGLYGQSSVRKVHPTTGTVLMQVNLSSSDFGEGLARVGDELVQLTFREQVAYVYDIQSFTGQGSFSYTGQGWGLCYDGRRFVMSNGSSLLFFRDPATFQIVGQVVVTLDGSPLDNLNELECVGSVVYANVWLTDTIVRIDVATGVVLTEIDASGLLTPEEQQQADVLNGIAFDPSTEHFFLTGKLWPKVFEVAFDFNPYGPCAVGRLSEVTGVLVGKDGSGGLVFHWDPDLLASEYHVNSGTSTSDLQPPGLHRPDLPGGHGVAQCDAFDRTTSCTDPDGISDPAPLLFYQVYAACGPLGADEGPP
jgi:glutaminyl-peptide cyclotransferase